MLNNKVLLSFLLLVVSSFPGVVTGQDQAVTSNNIIETIPEDPYGRGTPRGSLVGFLESAAKLDFKVSAEYLDLRHLPPEAADIPGEELARQLNFVLSRAVWIDDYAVNNTADGTKGDGLPDYRDEFVRIKTREGEVVLYWQHVPRSDGELIWKVSNRSLAFVPALYEEFGHKPWVEAVRSRLPEDSAFLGLEAYKWVIALSLMLLSWPVLYLIALVLARVFSRPSNPGYPLVRKTLTGPLTFLGILAIGHMTLVRLGVGAVTQQIMEANTLIIVAGTWLLWTLVNLYRNHNQTRLVEQGRPGAAQLLKPISLLVKIVLLLGGILIWMSNVGINISTMLTGLGIGGLALALALQKPLEDLMGAMTLFSQAPVRVGDFCRYGQITGVVEDIGLRTTRIRTLADSLVSIPNSRIALVEIENYSVRNMVHYKPVLRLGYDTSPQQLRAVLEGIKRALENNPRVLKEPLRIRFTDFDKDAVLVKVHAYVDTNDISEFLEVSEELNISIMKILYSAGVEFALPGKAVQLRTRGGLPADFSTLTLILASAFFTCAMAQESPPAAPVVAAPEDRVPEDALNRGTPRRSVVGYLQACSVFDFDKAAEYLDLRNLPDDVAAIGGHELARQLNHVLARAVWLDDYTVSDSPDGLRGDDLPEYRDELVRIKTADGEIPLWMQHVPRGDGEKIWKLSNRSVARIPELYDEFSYPEDIERIRGWFPEDASFLGLEAFKWFIVLSLAALAWPVFYFVALLLTRLISSPSKSTYQLIRRVITGPLVAASVLILTGMALRRLGVGPAAETVLEAKTISTIIVAWALWSIINLIKKHQQDKLNAQRRPGAAKLMNPMATLFKMLVVLMATLFWLSNIGVNITTVLAGLGVGGLALALALQKPLEDMMGALTLFSQAPMRVGDFCRYGEIMGTVEDIGLRTTRIRTLANTLVSIPNSRIAHVEIENFSLRKKVHFKPVLRLGYDTSPDQLSAVLGGIRTVLESHAKVHDEPLRVRFTDFDEDALLLKIHAYIDTDNIPDFLEISEELNFEIMEVVSSAGVSFALPARTIYMEENSPQPV
jgi:MscS family membrane protein